MYILTNENIRRVEEHTDSAGTSYEQMMSSAGKNAGLYLCSEFPDARHYAIFIGRGRNGGDGCTAAQTLCKKGKKVTIIKVFAGQTDSLSSSMLSQALSLGAALCELASPQAEEALKKADMVVDAIFGIGFHGELTGPALAAVTQINACGKTVAAMDIPSGLSEESCEGTPGVKADLTLSMMCLKFPQVLKPMSYRCGRTVVMDIGADPAFIASVSSAQTTTAQDVGVSLGQRRYDSNKGDFGKVLIAGGSYNMPGALSIAARGALYSGAGLVTLCFPDKCYPAVAPRNPEALLLPLPSDEEGRFNKSAAVSVSSKEGFSSVALGCGMGRSPACSLLTSLIVKNMKCPVVLDADAINAAAEDRQILQAAAGELILTPHPGEISRLTGKSIDEILEDPIGTARDLAEMNGVTVVLKTANTVIASKDGRIFINTTGGPSLSRGGSGDLLTGLTAGLAARLGDPLLAARCAVFIHGAAGDLAAQKYGENSAGVMNTAEMIPEVIRSAVGR